MIVRKIDFFSAFKIVRKDIPFSPNGYHVSSILMTLFITIVMFFCFYHTCHCHSNNDISHSMPYAETTAPFVAASLSVQDTNSFSSMLSSVLTSDNNNNNNQLPNPSFSMSTPLLFLTSSKSQASPSPQDQQKHQDNPPKIEFSSPAVAVTAPISNQIQLKDSEYPSIKDEMFNDSRKDITNPPPLGISLEDRPIIPSDKFEKSSFSSRISFSGRTSKEKLKIKGSTFVIVYVTLSSIIFFLLIYLCKKKYIWNAAQKLRFWFQNQSYKDAHKISSLDENSDDDGKWSFYQKETLSKLPTKKTKKTSFFWWSPFKKTGGTLDEGRLYVHEDWVVDDGQIKIMKKKRRKSGHYLRNSNNNNEESYSYCPSVLDGGPFSSMSSSSNSPHHLLEQTPPSSCISYPHIYSPQLKSYIKMSPYMRQHLDSNRNQTLATLTRSPPNNIEPRLSSNQELYNIKNGPNASLQSGHGRYYHSQSIRVPFAESNHIDSSSFRDRPSFIPQYFVHSPRFGSETRAYCSCSENNLRHFISTQPNTHKVMDEMETKTSPSYHSIRESIDGINDEMSESELSIKLPSYSPSPRM